MNSEIRNAAAHRDVAEKVRRLKPYVGSVKLSVTQIDGQQGILVSARHQDQYMALDAHLKKLGENMPAVLRAWTSAPKKFSVIGQPS